MVKGNGKVDGGFNFMFEQHIVLFTSGKCNNRRIQKNIGWPLHKDTSLHVLKNKGTIM